jgi:glycosyltransferase involved in cell wall biosynthesis
MVERGHKVHVSAPEISADMEAKLRSLGANVHHVALGRTGTNPLTDIAYAISLYRIMRRIRADRVIGYTIKPNIWGSIAAYFAGGRSASMVTGLGLSFIPGGGMRRQLLQALMQKLYGVATKSNDRVIFQNPDDRRDFIAAGCLSDQRKAVLVNGSGVDTAHYTPEPLPDGPVFLMIARLLVSKGVREYAEAALSILRERSDCRFMLAGFIDEGPDAISRTELDNWIEGGLCFLGSLDDVRPALADASVYVLPSYREGTPRSVLEAMSMGRPIITTDVPGCRETVVDGMNGYLVPERDADALAAAMRMLADDTASRVRMGDASHQIAVGKYAVDKVNATLMEHLGL